MAENGASIIHEGESVVVKQQQPRKAIAYYVGLRPFASDDEAAAASMERAFADLAQQHTEKSYGDQDGHCDDNLQIAFSPQTFVEHLTDFMMRHHNVIHKIVATACIVKE